MTFILLTIFSLIHKAQTLAVKFDRLISCVKDFLGDPVVKTPPTNAGGGEVQSLVGELRTHMP